MVLLDYLIQQTAAQPTWAQRLVALIRANPVVTLLAFVGTTVVALSTFTNAMQNLMRVFARKKTTTVEGKWTSDVLTNQFDSSNTYTYRLDLHQRGDTVLGSLTEAGAAGGYRHAESIMEGKISGTTVTFSTLRQETGDYDTPVISYRDTFSGSVKKDGTIAFIQTSDRPGGFSPQEFVMKRQ